MTIYLMRVEGFANGAPCPIAGQYLASFDHEAGGGLGYGTFTRDPAAAQMFAGMPAAIEFWRRPSVVRPLREDGQPNRPLTASTLCLVRLDEAIAEAQRHGG